MGTPPATGKLPPPVGGFSGSLRPLLAGPDDGFVLKAIAPLALGGLVYYAAENGRLAPPPSESFHRLASGLIAFFWIPFGAALGLLLEFNFRVDSTITYEQLDSINLARWEPWQRFTNTVLVAYVFAAFIGFEIVRGGLGSILLDEFVKTKPILSLVIGFVTGFSGPYVQDIISRSHPESRAAAKS